MLSINAKSSVEIISSITRWFWKYQK